MSNEVSKDLLERIESGYSLPSLSPVAMKLVEIALDDNCSAEDLASLVEKDPSLAVRVLKLANSAFFHTSLPTSSLQQAVVKLGFQRLRIMALSISLRDTFPMGKIGTFDYMQFWRITLYRALIAKSIAVYLRNCYPEEAFVAGLTMEIGLLILFDLMIKEDTEGPPIALEPLDGLLDWERKHYGVDHRQIGEAALRCWRFPHIIVQCQSFYGASALSPEAPLLSKIYELSREFSLLISEHSVHFHAPFGEAQRLFGLHRDEINEILLTTFDQVQEVAENLAVEVNKERDLWEIMEKANKALGQISEKMSEYREITRKESLPSFSSLDERETLREKLLPFLG